MTAALIYALCAAVLFATGLILADVGLRYRSARRGAAVSIPTAAIFFAAISPFAIDPTDFSRRAVAVFAIAGLSYPALVTLLTFEAARRVGPGIAAALGNLTPIFAVLFAAFILGEAPRLPQMGGIALVVAGVVLISLPGTVAARAFLGWALFLPLVGAALRGGLQPVVKIGLSHWPDAFAAALIGYLVSAVVVTGTLGLGGEPPAARPRGRGILCFALAGLSNGFAVLLLYAALGLAPVTLVSPVVAIHPLFTLALGAVAFRGTRMLSGRQIAGIGATVAGVALLLAG